MAARHEAAHVQAGICGSTLDQFDLKDRSYFLRRRLAPKSAPTSDGVQFLPRQFGLRGPENDVYRV